MIRHAKGHATHLHVRFYSPVAEETGRRCHAALLAAGKIKPSTHFVSYKAKKGDTLLSLAKRFGTTVKAIKRVNGLRSNTILAKRSYKIPSTGHSVIPARPAEVPPRRLPPTVRGNAALTSEFGSVDPNSGNETVPPATARPMRSGPNAPTSRNVGMSNVAAPSADRYFPPAECDPDDSGGDCE
jgi:penicillin-insensitive murein endopeptidase